MTFLNQAKTDDVRIREINEVAPPSHLLREFPASDRAVQTTYEARQAIHRILHGADDRLLVVIGPCSVHNIEEEVVKVVTAEKKGMTKSFTLQIPPHSVVVLVNNAK